MPRTLGAVGRERDQLADVARGPLVDAVELGQQPADRVAGGEARRVHAGPAAETVRLDPRVLAEHPGVGRREPAAEAGLDARVVTYVSPSSGGNSHVAEQLELPVRQRRRELLELVRVPRRQDAPSRVPLDAAHVLEVA